MIHKEKLTGVILPIATPFIDEEVACAGLAENIKKYNDTGLKGYMVLGSNGEFQSLTQEESLKIVDIVQKEKAPEKTLIIGGVAGMKAAMNLLGYFGGEPRNPLLPLSTGEVEGLRRYFKEEGFV